MRRERGQILVGVIIIMLIMAVLIPVMVMYTQNESRWSVKQTRNLNAFQLAEGGVDRGFRRVTESTTTWADLLTGTVPSGYRWDQPYKDLSGGCYVISVTSGPEEEQATVTSIGIHSSLKETRAIQAVYENAPMGDTAVYSRSGVGVTGKNIQVEWGAVVSAKSIDMNGRLFPQRWSSGNIDLDTNGSEQPNCDQDPPGTPKCIGWHSYEINIPQDPGLDPLSYYNDAYPATYYEGNQAWGGPATPCNNATLCDTGLVYYINGNLDVTNSMYVRGVLFVTGNVSMDGGNKGAGEVWASLPRQAWQQYGLGSSWDHYKNEEILKVNCAGGTSHDPVDSTAPAAFPGLTSAYKSPAAAGKCIDKVVVNGFFYVGGNLAQSGGGGNTNVIGAMYVAGDVTIGTNNIYIWYSDDAGDWLKTTSVILTRKSWKDLPYTPWPTGQTCN